MEGRSPRKCRTDLYGRESDMQPGRLLCQSAGPYACLRPRKPEPRDGGGGLVFGRPRRVDRDGALVRRRLLERLELAPEQRGRHIFVMARGDPALKERLRTPDINKANVRPRRADAVAIGALERRAGHDPGPSIGGPKLELLADPVEPGSAVGVGQRNSLPHLLDIGLWMQAVALHERPAEPPGDEL